jgi:alanine racemase
MFETSVIEMSRTALETNLGFIRDLIGSERKLSCVVKGNAYGHGIEEYIPLAEQCGVDHFSVFSADEAVLVFQAKRKSTEVVIMGSVDDDALAWAIDNGIEFWVFEAGRLEQALKLAQDMGKKAKIHIELETGMNRTGFSSHSLNKVIEILSSAWGQFELKAQSLQAIGGNKVQSKDSFCIGWYERGYSVDF